MTRSSASPPAQPAQAQATAGDVQ